MTTQAPSRLQFNVAPNLYEDPSIAFNDLQEQLMVANVDHRPITWRYAQRDYVLEPGARPRPVKLEIIIKYLGDPRSAPGIQNVIRVPGEQVPATVPDRYKELRRLSVLYGVYEGMMERLADLKFKDMPKDRTDPSRDLWQGMDPNWYVVPRFKVLNLDAVEIKFPAYYPDAHPYRYESDANEMMGDVRSELDRTRAILAKYQDRIETLEELATNGQAEIPGATADTVQPPLA